MSAPTKERPDAQVREISQRWATVAPRIPVAQAQDGKSWVPVEALQAALNDIAALVLIVEVATKGQTNAQRKARKAKKKIQGSLGDTPVKGVAEQPLRRTTGGNARSDATKETTQSQSVSKSLGSANEAEDSVAVRLTSGSSGTVADANGSPDVEGRQSLHLLTSTADGMRS